MANPANYAGFLLSHYRYGCWYLLTGPCPALEGGRRNRHQDPVTRHAKGYDGQQQSPCQK